MLIILYLFRRSGAKSTQLKLGSNVKIDESSKQHLKNNESFNNEKSINVIFNYNGHSWDAYEVLGLPAGSSIEQVTISYHEAIKNLDTNSQEIIRAAYQAILIHKNN